jgi:tetratricopeptide (TPR) repeat protein
MATEQADDKGRKQLEEEVWSAIAAFEQILEAMPEDRASLETLSHAYGQIGDQAKAYEYLLRLGRVLVADGDQESALELLGRLRELSGNDAEGIALLATIEKMGPAPEALPEQGAPQVEPTDTAVRMAPNMSEELAFTWNLLQASEVTQEEYASVVQDLTEMSTADTTATVSVLHALEARGFKGVDRVVAYVSQDCGVPYIALDSFDIPREAGSLLPLDFVVRRGALVFDFLGPHALAVLMNPYDNGLRKDIETLAQRPCHFYITHAAAFDRAVDRISDVDVEASSDA